MLQTLDCTFTLNLISVDRTLLESWASRVVCVRQSRCCISFMTQAILKNVVVTSLGFLNTWIAHVIRLQYI